jgi:hypothetical protein
MLKSLLGFFFLEKLVKFELKFLQLEEIEFGLFENHMASMEDPRYFDEHLTKVAIITGLSSSIPCMCVCVCVFFPV